jgi:hypothetical protein
MSLFRPYSYKDKPDLPANAPVKNGFFLFWELYFRKFWRFFTLNLIYFVITFPMLLYVFYFLNGYFADSLKEVGSNYILLEGVNFIALLFDFVPTFLYTPILILSILLYGPATMGITYIFRNFAREEHAWTTDIFSRGKSNFLQGLFFGIADVLIISLLVTGILGNPGEAGRTIGYSLSVILSMLCTIALIVWLFMRHYTYMTAVTVKLSVFAILKNAWLFVVLGFGRNVISLAVTLAMIVICFLLSPILTLFLLPIAYYSFTWFCTVFTCYPVIKKYIIVPALEAQKAKQVSQDKEANIDNEPAD